MASPVQKTLHRAVTGGAHPFREAEPGPYSFSPNTDASSALTPSRVPAVAASS